MKLTYGTYKVSGDATKRNYVKVITSAPKFVSKLLKPFTTQQITTTDEAVFVKVGK